MARRRAVASWSAAVPSAAFGLMSDGKRQKRHEKTGALQKLRQYRGMCVPRASPALAGECGCSFCRFGLSYRQLLIILRPTLSSLTLRSSACLLGLCVRNLLESFVSILSFHSFKMVLP